MKNWIWALIATLIVMGLSGYQYKHRTANTDVIAYVGNILLPAHQTPESLQSTTYGLLKKSISPADYKILTEASPYRQSIYSDAKAFSQMLGYYDSRQLYLWVAEALSNTGLGLVEALTIISVVGYFLILLLAYVWCAPRTGPVIAISIAFLIGIMAPMSNGARGAAPDLISSAAVLWALYGMLETRHYGVSLVSFLISVAFRPDNFIRVLGTPVLAWDRIYVAKDRRLQMLVAGTVILALVLAFLIFPHSYGWKSLIYFGVEKPAYPADLLPMPFDLEPYFIMVKKSFWKVANRTTYGYVGVIFAILWILRKMDLGADQAERKQKYERAIWVLLAWAAARYALYPDPSERYFIPEIVGIILITINFAALAARRRPADT